MKNKLLFNILTIILLIIFSSVCVLATTDMNISPADTTVSQNDQFVVHVEIDTNDSVALTRLDINFDPNVLEALSVSEGGFLSQDGDPISDLGNNINNTNGKVTFYMMISTPLKGVNGSGNLTNITFKALVKNNVSSLTIDNVLIGHTNTSNVTYSITNNGTVNVVTLEDIVINEFLPDPNIVYATEWIELYNNGTTAVNLTGWTINDTLTTPSVIVTIPDNTIIQSNSYLIFNTSNKLNNGGDGILLIDNSLNVVDNVSYSSNPGDDVSTGRKHDGWGEWINFTTPTPNAANNRLPDGTIPTQNITEDINGSFNISDYITDPDNDSMTFSIVDENVSEVEFKL